MQPRRRTYVLRIRRTSDGQLRIELKPLKGPDRYFKSLAELLEYLRREWPSRP